MAIFVGSVRKISFIQLAGREGGPSYLSEGIARGRGVCRIWSLDRSWALVKYAEKLPGSKQTNNRAEMTAALHVLKVLLRWVHWPWHTVGPCTAHPFTSGLV